MGKRKTNAASPAPAAPKGRVPIWVFWLIGVAFLAIFLGRWLVSLTDSYFNAFILRDATVAEAAANMGGLDLTVPEREQLLSFQREWDLFASSRLRDEVTATSADGTELHGYLYNEESDTTVVVLPRFDLDGTADFLPGPWLNSATGCNILLPDPRAHGKSGGECFSYGYLERYDLTAWLDWADETLGKQRFILWGEGTGANTILFAAADGLLSGRVQFAVAESPYGSLHQLAEESMWTWYQLPAFPFLGTIERKLARSGLGFTVEDLELSAALEGSDASLPVVFLQSAADAYIHPEWTVEVYDAYPGPKKIVNGGGNHGTVYPVCMEDIQALLDGWSIGEIQE